MKFIGQCANSAYVRQSKPDSGLGLSHFQVEVLKTFQVVPFSLGRTGPWGRARSRTGRCSTRGALVFNAHRLVYHSTLGLRVIKKKKKHASSPPRRPPPSPARAMAPTSARGGLFQHPVLTHTRLHGFQFSFRGKNLRCLRNCLHS